MKIPGYVIDIEVAVESINKNGYKSIAVQIPEGLKKNAWKIVKFLEEETKSKIIVIADPCFGACDIANCELKNIDIDFLIQIGHTELPTIKNYWIPSIFINAKSKLEISDVIEKAIPKLTGEKIGILTTAQHLHKISEIKKILKNKGFQPIASKGDGRISTEGQILGCNFTAAIQISESVDSFLFIGSGNFHPLGILISTSKPTVAADPYTNSVKTNELEELKDTILRQRYGAIANSGNAKKFAILVGLKRGQQRIKLVEEIKNLLDSHGKKSINIAMDNFSFSFLQGFSDIDCFISTACPRIAIDDYLQYKIPIITPQELEIVLNKKKWEDYCFDQILE